MGLESAVQNLQVKLKETKDEINKAVAIRVQKSNEERRLLQIKHECLCAENRDLKNENEAIGRYLNSSNVTLKSSRKVTKERPRL